MIAVVARQEKLLLISADAILDGFGLTRLLERATLSSEAHETTLTAAG